MNENSIPLPCRGQNSTILVERAQADAYTVGDQARVDLEISDAMVRAYAEDFGDRNPIHLDEAAGRASVFRGRVAHGMLSMNFFSTLLGAGYPGPGTIFLGVETWSFKAPVRIGERLTFTIRVANVRAKANGSAEMVVEANAANPSGSSVMSGQLKVIAPKLA